MSKASSAPDGFSAMLGVALHRLYGTTDAVVLAERCGVTEWKIEGYLSGKLTPSIRTFACMCKGLSHYRLAQLVLAAEEPAGTQ